MANPTYFTVVADFKSVVVDLDTDVDPDPQLGPVTAKVTFTPVLNNGDVILATNASPRPTVFVPAPIVARIDTDGRLKLRVAPDGDRDNFANVAAFPSVGNATKVYFAIDTQTFYRWKPAISQYREEYAYAQVRLLADTPLLELDSPLYYKVTFSDVVYNGGPGYINSFTFQAPTSDTELNLVEVLRQPGQPASGITKIAPGAVRAAEGNLIFSFNGVDIPEPIPYTDINVTMSATDITDSTVTGRALMTAADAAAVQAIAAPTATAVQTAAYTASPGQLVLADATAGGFTVTLPSAPAAGSTIIVKKLDMTLNTVLIQRAGSDVFNDGPSTLQLSQPGQTVKVVYASGIWAVTANSTPIAALDDRYLQKSGWLPCANGRIALDFQNITDSVNYVRIRPGTAGSPPSVQATGSDANVDLRLSPKGSSGGVAVVNAAGDNVAAFLGGTSPVNRWIFYATQTGNSVRAVATGSDTNVSMNLATKGTGTVQANGVDVVTTSGTQSLTNKTITSATVSSPKINNILDTNGSTVVGLVPTASAVNYVSIFNDSGTTPTVGCSGTGTNLNLALQPKGTGQVQIYAGAGVTPVLAATGSGTDKNLNLVTKGAGTVQANSVDVVTVSGTQTITGKNLTSVTNTFPTLNQNTTGTASNVTGTVAVGNGGTGATTLTGLVKGTGTTAMVAATAGTDFIAPGGALGTPSSGTLTNCTFPTLNQNTTGTASALSSTLIVGSGGTGVTTLTGLVKGNGTSAMSAAVAGTDFVAPGGAAGTPSSLTLTNASGLPVSGITASTSTALGVGSIELGHASDTSITRSAAGVIAVEGIDVVTTSGTQSLTNKTITSATVSSPKINNILDTNGSTVVGLVPTASAVNYVSIFNDSGTTPTVGCSGTGTNLNLALQPKGTGQVQIYAGAGVTPVLAATGSGTDKNLNLVTKGAGTVQANGNPLGVKVAVPASAAATGVVGQWAADSSWIYVCTAVNTWVRGAMASW